jgi:DNA-binding HxlR family transcriptional regulator
MRRASLSHMACSVAKTVDIVGDPWTLLVVRDALVGVTRFEDFHRRLGTPRATLTSRLTSLVDTGVLAKDDGEYHLTEKGRALRPVIVTLMQWGDHWVRDDEPPTRAGPSTARRAWTHRARRGPPRRGTPRRDDASGPSSSTARRASRSTS